LSGGPDSRAAELVRQVRLLELASRREVSSAFVGNYVTGVRGGGMEFHEARQYQPGDPVRRIDWNMTARTDEPWVRTYLEEREREIFVAVDVSPSMRTGWQRRTKLQTAIEAAAALGAAAERAGDKLGWVVFSDRVHAIVPPARGPAHFYRMLLALVREERAPARSCDFSDPRAAIHAVQSLRGRRFVVFVVSDFVDHDVPRDLAYVRGRHDVSLLHVYDPLEYAGPGPVRILAHSPEGAPRSGPIRLEAEQPFEVAEGQLRLAARRNQILVHSLSTDGEVVPSLARFFAKKARFGG